MSAIIRPLSPVGRTLITSFGLGYLRPASGTWGSLPPAAVGAGLVLAGSTSPWLWVGVMAGFLAVFSAACVCWGEAAELAFGKKDPSQVVADETAGMALTLMAMPFIPTGNRFGSLVAIAGAFLVWRLADIIKPPPAHGLQAVPGGWGILIDDLIAAFYAAIACVIIGRLVF